MENIYTAAGYSSRKDYLNFLAEEYGVPINQVKRLADILGEEEDFDLLVSMLDTMILNLY
jgi:hypothetical protein